MEPSTTAPERTDASESVRLPLDRSIGVTDDRGRRLFDPDRAGLRYGKTQELYRRVLDEARSSRNVVVEAADMGVEER